MNILDKILKKSKFKAIKSNSILDEKIISSLETDYKPIYRYSLDNIEKKEFYCIDLNFMNRFSIIQPENNDKIINRFILENKNIKN